MTSMSGTGGGSSTPGRGCRSATTTTALSGCAASCRPRLAGELLGFRARARPARRATACSCPYPAPPARTCGPAARCGPDPVIDAYLEALPPGRAPRIIASRSLVVGDDRAELLRHAERGLRQFAARLAERGQPVQDSSVEGMIRAMDVHVGTPGAGDRELAARRRLARAQQIVFQFIPSIRRTRSSCAPSNCWRRRSRRRSAGTRRNQRRRRCASRRPADGRPSRFGDPPCPLKTSSTRRSGRMQGALRRSVSAATRPPQMPRRATKRFSYRETTRAFRDGAARHRHMSPHCPVQGRWLLITKGAEPALPADRRLRRGRSELRPRPDHSGAIRQVL